MGKSRKGGVFERKIAGDLSLWWSSGKRDDIFWRTSTSGARATSRKKVGKSTHGQNGDICATDPMGEPLLKVFCLELKNGYSKYSPYDAIDKADKAAPQLFEKWIEQASDASVASNSLAWMLIFKRNCRKTMVALPKLNELNPLINVLNWMTSVSAQLTIKAIGPILLYDFMDFLCHVKPQMVRDILRDNLKSPLSH